MGLARFGLLTRLVTMWLLCIPVITTVVIANPARPELLPLIWLIFSIFEVTMGAVCFWRIIRAIGRKENRLLGTSIPEPIGCGPDQRVV
jgi:MATE family multidrug resistance protein